MARVDLILTADYEVWGNGDGCVEKCVIDPSEKMMAIAEKHGARITFFLDICEYWAFEQVESSGRFNGKYKPATLIKDQLQDAVARGHDVQLHFHPQWLNYTFISNHKWNLDFRYWRLPEVDNYHTEDWNVEKLFIEGVNSLEELFRPVKSDYKVHTFRAGAWCIQPENSILNAIKKTGILVDSTVAPGRKDDTLPNYYDFFKTPEETSWKIGKKVNESGASGILEIPISTARLSSFESLYFKFLKLRYKSQILPKNCVRSKTEIYGNIGLKKKLSNIFNQQAMLNFSDGTSFKELKTITERVVQKFESKAADYIPLVAISHPKTFGYSAEFERYLTWADKIGKVTYSTYSEALKKLADK